MATRLQQYAAVLYCELTEVLDPTVVGIGREEPRVLYVYNRGDCITKGIITNMIQQYLATSEQPFPIEIKLRDVAPPLPVVTG